MAYYGYPRATGDIDVWVAIDPGNAERIVAALREFGFDSPELKEELFLRPDNLVRMGNPPLRIEVKTSVSGLTFDECEAAAEIGRFGEVEVPIVSLAHLRVNKKAARRAKDLDDLENLA